MSEERYVVIPNTRAVSDDFSLICEVGGRRVGVPQRAIHPRSEVRRAGDRGALTLVEWVAIDLGLGHVGRPQ